MIKVMIALHGKLYSEGLKSLIESLAGGMEVAGVFEDEDGERAYELAERLRPQVILTDMKTLSASFPIGAPEGSSLIIIGADGEDLADLILNGTVCGALNDSSGPLTLETAIKAVSMGVVWIEGAWPKRRNEGNERALPEHEPGPAAA